MVKQVGRAVFFCSLVTTLAPLPVLAEENMRFRGELIELPPCVINGGEQIEVNFGRIGVGKVDGVNYMQTVDYRLECAPGSGGSGLGLTLISTNSPRGQDIMVTNLMGLGLRMTLNGKPLNLNQRVLIDSENPPVMQAVPVEDLDPGWHLSVGTFEVLATLLADYQ
ncbi:fimbrial protein [Serratia sp. P2ACOL2]|uniref:fimbrial protein n=1 Tax=Serratia sp. P2ACOL2 TaxID=2482769 RepID=UPI000EFCFF76|nr:fimbrial protein [Serratia sp. P2ACOL2]AYO39782.1 pilus assembly protein [Serratia sp. P2ACOL2]